MRQLTPCQFEQSMTGEGSYGEALQSSGEIVLRSTERRGRRQPIAEQRDDLLGATLMFDHKWIARLSMGEK